MLIAHGKVFWVLFFVAACSPLGEGTQEPVPLATPTAKSQACEAPATWSLEFHRSGGFAGFNESLTLGSDGELHIHSQRPAAEESRQLSEEQLEETANLLARACPFEPEPDERQCADCFYYQLEVQMNGRSYVLAASDTTLGPELHPLIGKLSQLLQSTAP